MDHMKELRETIGFSPTSFLLPEKEDVHDEAEQLGGDQNILAAGSFPRTETPVIMTEEDKKKISAVRVTNFPSEISER